MVSSVLFVCTGNTCRSVMAEYILRQQAKSAGLKLKIASAGLAAFAGDSPAKHTLAVLREMGIDAAGHRSRPIHEQLAAEFDLILTMTAAQKGQLLSLLPDLKNKVFLLKELADRKGSFTPTEYKERDYDILDPFGQSLARYKKTSQEIKGAIQAIVQGWIREREMNMKIVIGADHGGFPAKQAVIEFLEGQNYTVEDFGTFSEESCDYPDIAHQVAAAVAKGEFARGVLICGTGIGMSLAANKVAGIRAAVAHNTYAARMAIAHNNANILCLGARVTGAGLMLDIVDAYFKESFEGGRHARRVQKIEQYKEQ